MSLSKLAQYGLGDPVMLDKIDKLFACGVGDKVALPQIVVVGDQSSGKSSVLEGLTNKPFPRDSGLCTRFATQIIFKRSVEERISASIIADSHASHEHRVEVEKWKPVLTDLGSEEFGNMMREVHQVMGLSSNSDDSTAKPTFSKDVLCLEIASPGQEHLSVIDVPGIFKNTTPGVTTKADIAMIRELVQGYMDNPRSVILTVIPANVDVATQEILEMASDVDPTGDRTLGILTKLDLVDKGAESRVLDLIHGRTRPMKLGWHAVRNPGQSDLSSGSTDRNTIERDFFQTTPCWQDIDADKAGVESLRGRLKEVLSALVRREFPKVKSEVAHKLTTAQRSLESLGPERSAPIAQVAFLADISTRFQWIVRQSLDAKYADEVFVRMPSLKIAPKITARMMAFSEEMGKYGHAYAFSRKIDASGASENKPPPLSFGSYQCPPVSSTGQDGFQWLRENAAQDSSKSAPATTAGSLFKPAATAAPFKPNATAKPPLSVAPALSALSTNAATVAFGQGLPPVTFGSALSGGQTGNFGASTGSAGFNRTMNSGPCSPSETAEPYDRDVTIRKIEDIEELSDILQMDQTLQKVHKTAIDVWLRRVYETSRGFELGTFDASILSTTMMQQSCKWPSISHGFVSDVIVIVHGFITDTLAAVCHDKSMSAALMDLLSEKLIDGYKMAVKQVDFLLRVERNGLPMTGNHYFNDNLEKCRQQRMDAALREKAFNTGEYGTVVRVGDAMRNHPMSNTDHIVRDIHDILQSYYKVARKRFVDNVLAQAMDYYLVNGPDTPLSLFSPAFIARLPAADLERIAGEAPQLMRKRAQLSKEIASLEQAKGILSRG